MAVKRSAAALRTNTVLTIGLPFVFAGGLLIRTPDDPVAAVVFGAATGAVLAPFMWWKRAANRYELRDTVLRRRGRDATTIDLAHVRVAYLERDQQPDRNGVEALQLKLFDANLTEVSLKLGDTRVPGEFSTEGLTAIADALEAHAETDARIALADWLRDYAYRPRVEAWPNPPA